MIKSVIFDWDGTLADTYPVISAAYDHTFKTLGLPRIPYDEVKRISSTLQNKDTLGHFFGEHKAEASAAYYDYIGKNHAANLVAMPGARDVLEYCQNAGLFSALITNKKTQYVTEEIDHLGFGQFFNKVIAAGEHEQDKPHPITTHSAFDGQLPAADSIMILGDGQADFLTARSYDHDGKKALCTIYDPKGKYQDSEPDFKITNLLDFITILKKKYD